MRIPSGVTDQYIYFVAVDSTDYATRETGLSSFTVYRSRNGGAAAAMTTPTINETDASNMPGVYELLLDEDMTIDSGDDSQEMVFHITHAGMAPVTRTIELYRPKITAGETLLSDSNGRVDVSKWLGTAVTTSSTTNKPEVDINSVSDDAAAANNMELMYDGTGYTDATAPASRQQVGQLSTAAGGLSTTASGFTKSGAEVETNAYTDTATDGTLHIVEDIVATGITDIYYEFNVGAEGVATSFEWLGYAQGASDTYTVRAYNWDGTAWDDIATISAANSTTQITETFKPTVAHTGTGANVGLVRLKFYSTDGLAIATNRLLCVYSQASAGITNGSTITLAASAANENYVGNNWNLALGGQAVGGIYVKGASVSGTGTGADVTFEDCIIEAGASIPAGKYLRCTFEGTSGSPVTESGTGQYYFLDCISGAAGSGVPYFNFAGAGGAVGVNNRRWAGGIHFTGDSNVTVSHEVLVGGGTTIVTGGGNAEIRGLCRSITTTLTGGETVQLITNTGDITIDGAGAGSTVNIWGTHSDITNTATGTPTVTDEGFDTGDATTASAVADAVWDEAQADHVAAGSFGVVASEVADILVDTNELQTDLTNGGRLDLLIDAILEDTGTTLPGLLSTIDGIVDAILVDTDATIPGLISALNNISAADVNAQVLDVLNTDTFAEPGQGAPGATITLAAKIGYLYKAWRNKTTQTATELTIYDDAGTTADQKSTVSDDGTTATRGEMGTGA